MTLSPFRPVALLLLTTLLALPALNWHSTAQPAAAEPEFATIRPILQKYCLGCHSTRAKKGSLDLERFTTIEQIRKDLKPWQHTLELVEVGEMPPAGKPQPTAQEKKQLLDWVRRFLDTEARARAGDPGYVPLRRLSNAEYDRTIHDLTGVDLRPTREFPADGAAGEGFTNAAEALSDISPALFTKYLNAARRIAEHVVLLPDGFRFSAGRTRRDWTDEATARLRQFYARFTDGEGQLPLQPYLAATLRHRNALLAGKTTLAQVAAQEKINLKYLEILWKTLTDASPAYPLDSVQARWRAAGEKDLPGLLADIGAWQSILWGTALIGSYRYGNTQRQIPITPPVGPSHTLRLTVKPVPGQRDVVLHLVSRNLAGASTPVVWQRPRLEAAGRPTLMLVDYDQFGPPMEVDFAALFSSTSKYLAVALEAARQRQRPLADLARDNKLDATWLQRWTEVLDLESLIGGTEAARSLGRPIPLHPIHLLDEKIVRDGNKPAINGWRRKGSDLPLLVSNASNQVEHVPGRMLPHCVAVHPTPGEFVGIVWTSPLNGRVRIEARIEHAHPACGNGVAWWLEHRPGNRARLLDEGVLPVGGKVTAPTRTVEVNKGDQLLLAVDARDANHVCDLTEVGLKISTITAPVRSWDLAGDVADSVLQGNPHADRLGHANTWSFVRGPARPIAQAAGPMIPPGSVLARWREAAAQPERQAELSKRADEVQALLSGPRPGTKDANGLLYDNLVSMQGALLYGLEPGKIARPRGVSYGLERSRFGKHPAGTPEDPANLVVAGNSTMELRLPAALFADRQFAVEVRLATPADDRAVLFQVLTSPPDSQIRWDGKTPLVASRDGAGVRAVQRGLDAFRACFPRLVCFPHIIPTDEVVCLKMFHREDEPLIRLFLDDKQRQELDRLWAEHRFISQQPRAENDYLPQFIGYVTQDQPKELLDYFEGQRGVFQKRADDFGQELAAAIPRQMAALLDFASRAYRRPLSDKEKTDLQTLYEALRKKGLPHEEAFRGVLARVLVAPAFLFRVEKAPPGKQAGPVDDWELASRLSYFLWSSQPDEPLRKLAAAGQLRDPAVLAAQARRLLADDRIRALAIEFGTQWIHVRGFDEFNEKNEKLFPTFTPALRQAMYEEAIHFFQDLFQADRSIEQILEADYTFLNETLAKHYGIPGVVGPEWRRVEGVRRHGRGGVLGLAAVQAKQAGASRTSPILRGNWVVETLLGEKLPRPPANVPRLPEEEGNSEGQTMRQLVEKHARVPECAVCHQRIDPFGFALEGYDPIGQRREKDLGGLAVDARARLKDGSEFEGLDGLRSYLRSKKKEVIERLFCRRLLGYALGRAVTLSDQSLIDDMMAQLKKNNGRLSAAVLAIVRSPQFRMIRGADFDE